MARGIEVTPERLREVSAQMSTGAADVGAVLARLSRDVAPVRSEWAGAAQEHFNTLWDRLQHDATDLDAVLNGIAKLTESAAAAYEATELSIAQAFDTFRAERVVVPGVSGGTAESLVAMAEIDDISAQLNEIEDALSDTVPTSETAEIDEPAEIDKSHVDEDGLSLEQPKASARLPWTRFMTKGAHGSEPQISIEGRRRERRFKTSDPNLKPGTRLCRLCFTVVALEPEFIEKTETHVYVCCPYCGRSFPIRQSDVETLFAAKGSDQST
jgi:WXG100 family type VII secretion target